MSDDSTWLKFIVSEIAEAAPWEDKSAPHAAAHIRNLILNLKAEANAHRKLYEHAMKTIEQLRKKLEHKDRNDSQNK